MSGKVLMVRAWAHESSPSALLHHAGRRSDRFSVPLLVMRMDDMTHEEMEAELKEGLSLLAKSREVCEWNYVLGEWMPPTECATQAVFLGDCPAFCPSCGRRVSIKESPND